MGRCSKFAHMLFMRLFLHADALETRSNITVEFRWRGRRHASHAGQSWLRSGLSRAYLQRIVSPHFALNRTGRGGRRQNPIRADHLRRATGLSVFGLLDYRGRRHGRLHSPRAEMMTEKSAVTPSAISVQTKKKAPLELAMLPPSRRGRHPSRSCG
jgi:hypothetical protein